MMSASNISITKERFAGHLEATNAISRTKAGSSAIDFRPEKHDTPPMTDAVSRYELDAKLEAIETKMDAKIDRIIESNVRIESGMSSLKTAMIVTAVSSVLAIAAINVGIIQTMFGAFESGKTTAAAITQATEQMKQTQDQLKAIQERLDQQAKPPRK